MARTSKIGVRGLYVTAEGDFFRWRDPVTGKGQRCAERLPKGTKAAVAEARASTITSNAVAGKFQPVKKKDEASTLLGRR